MTVLYKILISIIHFWCKLTKVEMRGLENIPKEGSLIICANHSYLLDAFLMANACPNRQIHFAAKQELFENKFIAFVGKHVEVIPIDRGETSLSTMKTMLKYLKNGEVLGIYPEGTRTKTEDLLEFKSGVTVIAMRTGATIVPIGKYNCDNLWKFWKKRPVLVIGEAYTIPIKKGTPEEVAMYTEELKTKIFNLREQAKK